MSRNANCLSFLLLLLCTVSALPVSAAAADPVASIAFAEQPVRLLRATSFHKVPQGTRVQSGDLIESAAGTIQLDGLGAAVVGLGPGSRMYIKSTGANADLVLIDGWLKVQKGAGATINSGDIRFNTADSSVIVHASAGKVDLFVETGNPAVLEMQGAKQLHSTKIAREQYALHLPGKPLAVLPRAPKDFLGAMPPLFFDTLVPVQAKGAPPVLKTEPAATLAEVTPLVASEPALLQIMQRRYAPPKKAPAKTDKNDKSDKLTPPSENRIY